MSLLSFFFFCVFSSCFYVPRSLFLTFFSLLLGFLIKVVNFYLFRRKGESFIISFSFFGVSISYIFILFAKLFVFCIFSSFFFYVLGFLFLTFSLFSGFLIKVLFRRKGDSFIISFHFLVHP